MAVSQTIEKLQLLGKTDVMHQVYKMIGRLCNVDCAVLIIGEAGGGKKAVARALHYYSHRRSSPFHLISGEELRESTHEELLGIDESHPYDSTFYMPDWVSMPIFVHEQLLTIYRSNQYKCSHNNRYRKHHFRFI